MITLAVSALLASSMALQQFPDRDECRYEARRDATIRASASDQLRLVARAGELRVEGRDGISDVRVRGRACASSQDLLDRLVIESGRSGSTVRVEVGEIEWTSGMFRNQHATLDLVLEVPLGMAAHVEDGSGDVLITGLGDLSLVDGSGGLAIRDIRGTVDVEDGSGEVEIDEIDGDVSIEDGSGEITIRGVTGDVTVHDGSGSVTVARVGGSVEVPDDGSGEIDVRDVQGDLVVRGTDAENISYRDVRGRIEVPERRRRRR
jgi:hypothetical protein